MNNKRVIILLKQGYLIEGRGGCRGHYKRYADNRVTVEAISVGQHHDSSDGQNGSNNLVTEQNKGHFIHNVLSNSTNMPRRERESFWDIFNITGLVQNMILNTNCASRAKRSRQNNFSHFRDIILECDQCTHFLKYSDQPTIPPSKSLNSPFFPILMLGLNFSKSSSPHLDA